MALKFFVELIDYKEDFNVIINVRESPNAKKKKILMQSAVLRYSSVVSLENVDTSFVFNLMVITLTHPEKIFELEEFTSIQENVLILFIKRNELQMEEVKIWKHIIEWEIAQNPDIPPEPRNWSLTMKTTLQIVYLVSVIFKYLVMMYDIMKKLLSSNRPVSSVILPPHVVLTQTLPSRTTKPFSTPYYSEAFHIIFMLIKLENIFT
ncbi:hypothetical protein C2G38_2247647 [Gigaspora rosea]|uniref:BACK domain-containing protein n=1 Tax=Gigaspora rosea TaxID=44941 RepID=A0A397V346_9GLOM|nr:hypothetical protein C2G38_2247647 [Gigaspora rosea]